MLLLTNPGTADKLQLTSTSTSALDVHVSHVDASGANPPVVQGDSMGRTNTAITTATTTDICAGPASTEFRNVKTIHVRNKGAASNDVTILFDQAGTDFELFKATLAPGDCLEYIEGIGWFVVTPGKIDVKLRVAGSDYVNATTSFSDITGLTYPVESGKHYNFLAHLYHRSDATTSGSQFGINGPSMTLMSVNAIQQITSSVTAAAVGASPAVTAVDTAAVVETTGPGTNTFLAIVSGYFNPSAAGTFAMRGKSEVAVAAGLTVKVGSWCRLWET